ncbi:hypothetical protein T492DRAFT_200020 [Pavlovales sp. CCMP2436]|nr:hypothetical protein T492DRAFT_200020 [Pavlovales sp. CCMP2436]
MVAWTEHTAKDGRKYWHDKATAQTTWEKPDELKSASEAALGEWREFTAANGRAYFVHKTNGQTVWTRPVATPAAQGQPPPLAQGGAQLPPPPLSAPPPLQQHAAFALPPPPLSAPPPLAGAATWPPPAQQSLPPAPAAPAAPDAVTTAVETDRAAPTPPKAVTKATPAVPVISAAERARTLFVALLREKDVGSTEAWEVALRRIVHDGRYGLIPTLKERRLAFDAFQVTLLLEEKQRLKMADEATTKGFLELLDENAELLAGQTPFAQAEAAFAPEPRWQAALEYHARARGGAAPPGR